MADFDRGYRTGFRSYGAGNRKLEIVSGKVYSSNQTYLTRPPPPRSPDPPPCRARSSSGSWAFNDPEMKRRRRVASYKVYSVEGKVKATIRKGFRWIKGKCSDLVHGW